MTICAHTPQQRQVHCPCPLCRAEELEAENAQLKLALDAKLYSRRKLESDNPQLRAALQDLTDCCGHDDDKALLVALTRAAKTLLDCSSAPQEAKHE